MTHETGTTQTATALAALGYLFDASIAPHLPAPEVRSRAYRRAFSVLDSMPLDAAGAGIAALGLATDMFLDAAVDLAAQPEALVELLEQIHSVAGISRLALGREVLGAARLLLLPSSVAIEVTLTMLLGFADLYAAAIVTELPGGGTELIAQAGAADAHARGLRARARRLFDGDLVSKDGCATQGILLERRHRPPAALVVRGDAPGAEARNQLLESAAPVLSAVLERDQLLGQELESARTDMATAERRLSRLRFDLHDGPQQDVIMLAEDLRLFESQLGSVLADSEVSGLVLGRLADLQARLVAIDGDLRRIAAFVQSPFLKPEPFAEALTRICEKFAERCGIEPAVELHGDFGGLSDSQQITLLGLVREALSNVREHSDAKHVTVTLIADPAGVSGSITDDGRGFDPETMLVKAARDGHLGLVGMYERVRLLGGKTQIESRPGGPTLISVSLPPGPGRPTALDE